MLPCCHDSLPQSSNLLRPTFSSTRSKTAFYIVQICCVAAFKPIVHNAQTLLKTLLGVTENLRHLCEKLLVKMKFQRNILHYIAAKVT